jgi:hypothetical protein
VLARPEARTSHQGPIHVRGAQVPGHHVRDAGRAERRAQEIRPQCLDRGPVGNVLCDRQGPYCHHLPRRIDHQLKALVPGCRAAW